MSQGTVEGRGGAFAWCVCVLDGVVVSAGVVYGLVFWLEAFTRSLVVNIKESLPAQCAPTPAVCRVVCACSSMRGFRAVLRGNAHYVMKPKTR